MKTPKDVSDEAFKIQRASAGLAGFYDRFPPAFHNLRAPKPEQMPTFEKLVQALRAYDTWYRSAPESRAAMPGGILLTGEVGQGKSCMAALLAKFSGTRGYQPDYVHAMFAGDEVRASWRNTSENEKRGVHAFIEELLELKVNILHIDDLGAGSDVSLELCRSLIHFAADNNIFVIATTNLEWGPLKEYFKDERDASRLQRYRQIQIPANVPDYRSKK